MHLESGDLADYVRGAAMLGAGGGGDPYIGHLMLQQLFAQGRKLSIIPPASLRDDDLVASVACMGAPTVMTEKLPSIDALALALQELEAQVEREVSAIIPLEIGGINATVPLVLASHLGLPVVDADGMGRAFPEIQMVTFGVGGCPISPIVVTNERNDIVIVQSDDNKQGEDLARSVVTRMGGMAQIALYPMSGSEARRTCVPETLGLALAIGRSIGGAGAAGLDPFASLFVELEKSQPGRKCGILFDGKVVDVCRETRGGFNVGAVSLRGLNGDGGAFEVHYQNENTVAYRDGKVVAVVPDIIAILDRESAEPVTAERVKYGQRVKVLALTVPGVMTTPEALATFGPSAFSIDVAYRPFYEYRCRPSPA
ncbi:MAG: DUF917 domain-containing protein [Gammaproteobacteria bacterium]|nr:DUF917 domain-containing protein [Gammaproteobacteria bacterium]